MQVNEFRTLRYGLDWTHDRTSGSHEMWISFQGVRLSIQPKGKMAKGYQVKQFIKVKDKFDGFTVNIYQDEDEDYLAHFIELPSVSAFGNTPLSALKELDAAWKAVKESYGDNVPKTPARKEYTGQFNIRVDKRIHRLLAMEAARNGVSLNALVSQKLSTSVEMPE